MMMMDEVADFEEAAKKSWQSFSTMKRFVSEATRLENASWRLWFMQRSRADANAGDAGDEPDADADDVDVGSVRVTCVYCELHRANLSCNGCCHDAYCVSCFKIIHKKGNLATHTAVKIHAAKRPTAENESGTLASGATTSEESDPSTKALQYSASPDTNTDKTMTSSHSGPSSSVSTPIPTDTKPWELQMDMLLQRLMMNSIHSDSDISVHNIDNRRSLGALESISTIPSESEDAAQTGGELSESDEEARQSANEMAVATAVAVAGRYQTRSRSFDESHALQSPSLSPAAHPSASPTAAASTEGKVKLPPLPLFPQGLPRTNSRRKNAMCANCNGNHITINCPLLESSLLPPASSTTGGSGSGVDTVLRKCFTTIHNDNMSNSTHAFLGDEVSVRGGNNFAAMKPSSSGRQPLGDRPSPFGMNVIAEDNSLGTEDLSPVLEKLVGPNLDGEVRSWDSNSWLLSCLATDLPADAFESMRNLEKAEKTRSPIADELSPHSLTGWAYVKEMGRKWSKRFLSLYRNNLWEYLDANEASRPVGHANLFDGSLHVQQRSTTEFALKYCCQSSAQSPRSEVWLRFDAEKDAVRWREKLSTATKMQIDDLFDLTPDSPTCSLATSYELGKGRFSVVRRARRKDNLDGEASPFGRVSRDCALKIIEKNIFWDLVARETEREDTVVREILTQSLLTVRSGPSYCPVIRLQSLFETRNHLVMELELMRDGDLHEEIASNNAVDETKAPFLVASLVRAIAYCHRNGVAHRDVKLSNLALDYGRCPKGKQYSVLKVADFGMAAFIQKDGTLKGRCGTPGFVAPEILAAGKGEAYPSGVDMFSAGVVMYTMLCGYEPFFGVNDEELIQMNKRVEYEFEEPEWSTISDEAKDLISLMMEKDTKKRITPKQALEHPFLREANALLDDICREGAPISPTRLL